MSDRDLVIAIVAGEIVKSAGALVGAHVERACQLVTDSNARLMRQTAPAPR